MTKTRLLIVDDHAIVRQGVSMFLKTEPSIQIVGEAEDSQDAIDKAKSLSPDVILMDLVMPGEDGTTAIAELKRCSPEVKIIVLTTFDDEQKFQAAMQAGADGYILKDADGEALLQSIQAVRRGDVPLHPKVTRYLVKNIHQPMNLNGNGHLTHREKEVLALVVKGLSNQAVAEALHLSRGTVKVHVSNILSKLRATSRTEAAMLAIQMGLISPVES